MDVTSRKLVHAAALLPLSTAGLPALTCSAQESSGPAEIAASFEGGVSYVGDTGRAELNGVQITQGELAVEADRGIADPLDLENSDWRLEGDVRITNGEVRVTGQTLRFSIRNGELEHFVLEGSPATFESLVSTDAGRARGGAGRIEYDATVGRLQLLEEARLRVGPNEVLGCDLIYDVEEERFSSGSTECDRPFTVRVVPNESEDDAAADGARPAP